MSAGEIDDYLDRLGDPKRSTLSQLRRDILAVVPDAEQCISSAVPAFQVAGRTVAGFAAFNTHLSYVPHSGSVFPELAEELAGYDKSSGALRFPIDPGPTGPPGRDADRREDARGLPSRQHGRAGKCTGVARQSTLPGCRLRPRFSSCTAVP